MFNSNVLFKFDTLNDVIDLSVLSLLSKVFRLTFTKCLVVFSSFASSSVIADTFAPVSMRAYVGRRIPPDLTNIGTIGLVAPFRPTHAAISQSSSSSSDSISSLLFSFLFCFLSSAFLCIRVWWYFPLQV